MLDSAANLIKVQLSQGYDQNAVSVALVAGQGARLPAAPFNVTWWNFTDYPDPSDDPNVEIVRVTARATDTLTVTRAQEGTSASTKNASGKAYKMILGITAKMITDIGANLQKPWRYVNVSGAIDGMNTVFTISPVPFDPSSVRLNLAHQPQEQVFDYTISSGTITYISPPDGSLVDEPHTAQYQ
jgi:hypothetical protein